MVTNATEITTGTPNPQDLCIITTGSGTGDEMGITYSPRADVTRPEVAKTIAAKKVNITAAELEDALEAVDLFMDGVEYWVSKKYMIHNGVLWIVGPTPIFDFGNGPWRGFKNRFIPLIIRTDVPEIVIRNSSIQMAKSPSFEIQVEAIKEALFTQAGILVTDYSIGFPTDPQRDIIGNISLDGLKRIQKGWNTKKVSGNGRVSSTGTTEKFTYAIKSIMRRGFVETRVNYFLRVKKLITPAINSARGMEDALEMIETSRQFMKDVHNRLLILDEMEKTK